MNKHLLRTTKSQNSTGFLGQAKARLTSTVAVLSVTAITVITSVLIGSSSANAWGPTRNTFTMKVPSTYVTFDSITDNPDWGDERAFTVIKDVTGEENNGKTAASAGFANTATAIDGHTYMVKMFVHNNAAANFNLLAKNTRLMAYLPTASGDSAMIQGMIAADNCGANNSGDAGSPCSFWDEAYLNSAEDRSSIGNVDTFKVALAKGSLRYYNNVRDFTTDGFTLDDDNLLTSTGAKIGYEQMNGDIQGCFQYSGYATFLVRVTADDPSFTLEKQLRINGGEWRHTGVAQPGDTVEYRIDYKNVGNVTQNQVVIKDTLAKNISIVNDATETNKDVLGLNYIDGSTKLFNATTGNDGATMANDEWTTKGLNIGNYTSGSNAVVSYKTTVPTEDELQCGDNIFENTVIATTDNAGSKLATTQIVVTKECDEPVNPADPADPTPEPEIPGVPNAGVAVKTAVISLILFLACAVVLTRALLKKKHNK